MLRTRRFGVYFVGLMPGLEFAPWGLAQAVVGMRPRSNRLLSRHDLEAGKSAKDDQNCNDGAPPRRKAKRQDNKRQKNNPRDLHKAPQVKERTGFRIRRTPRTPRLPQRLHPVRPPGVKPRKGAEPGETSWVRNPAEGRGGNSES